MRGGSLEVVGKEEEEEEEADNRDDSQQYLRHMHNLITGLMCFLDQ